MKDTPLPPMERALLGFVLIVSLFLRVTATDVFVTQDEVYWHERSLNFSQALGQHNWLETYQRGHPGVLTMWLGTAVDRIPPLQQALVGTAGVARGLLQAPAATPGTGLAPLTVASRGLVGLVTWLAILPLFPLLRRLFGARSALLAVTLVALDPFYLAHSRLHHLDALLTAFATLSLVCLLVYRLRGRQIGYLLASGATAALATANKSPGVLLVVVAAVVLVIPSLLDPARRWKEARRDGRDLALWSLTAAFVFVAIWPAMWVDPAGTLRKVFDTAQHYAETPHDNLNYFWFAIRADPGPWLYPVAWLFRTTPWVLLGLASLAAFWRRKEERLPAVLLTLGALLFAAAMTVGEKKFDRYLLPVFPLLDVVAALGLAALYCRWRDVGRPGWARGAAILAPGLVLGQILLLWPTRPYYLSYYNPLVGGGTAASQVLLVGWGEALDQAAAYLNAKPNGDSLLVGTSIWYPFQPFFRGKALRLGELPSLIEPDYYLVYSTAAQRGMRDDLREVLRDSRPEHIIAQNGIEYAWIYANPLRQQATEAMAQICAQGSSAQDLILLDADAFLAQNYRGPVPYGLLPTSAPEGTSLSAVLSLAQTHSRLWRLRYPGAYATSGSITNMLAERGTICADLAVGNVHAVCYDLSGAVQPVLLDPSRISGARFQSMTLIGYDQLPETQPRQLHLRLYWSVESPVEASYTISAQLLDPQGRLLAQKDGLPQSGLRPTNSWRPGETILDDRVIELPANAAPGEYDLLVALYDLNTMERVPVTEPTGVRPEDRATVAGQVRVQAEDGL